jgi:hypothetical protein
MQVKDLIKALQALPAELQSAPVTFVREDFPRLIDAVCQESASVYGDHYHIEYYPEVADEPVFKIVVLG